MTSELEWLHLRMDFHAQQWQDLQKLRLMTNNRVKAFERAGWTESKEMASVRAHLDALEGIEHQLELEMTRLARQHPLRKWVENEAKGLSLRTFCLLLGSTGRLDRFATVSKLWAYLGMHVKDGSAPRRKKGERANWHTTGRTRCYLIGESIVKVGKGGPYREAYDRKKAEYLARERFGESGCPMGQEHRAKDGGGVLQCVKAQEDGTETSAHLHNAAMRYAVKLLLKDLWVEWHQSMPTEQSIGELTPSPVMTAA